MKTPSVADEQARQRRLDQLHLSTAEAGPVFELLVALAALLSGEPAAMISLIDHDREWCKSSFGLPAGFGGPREGSPCAQAMVSSGWFEVEDLRKDERFRNAPIVQQAPFAVHYAAVPLEMPGSERIGSFCVLGPNPRRLERNLREALVLLGRVTVQVMLLREQEVHMQDEVAQANALRESEARFRTIANTIPQMLWTAQPDGRIDYYNDRWYEYLGVPSQHDPEETWEAHVHPDDIPNVQAIWGECVKSGVPCEAEMRKRHHSGNYRWVLARAAPVKDEHGTVLRWVGTLTDIDEQKRAEAALRATDRRKDEFLAMLAHELRSPLAPIATAAHTLSLAPDDPVRVRHAAELIARQARHMTSLVNDLLDVSRVTRGTIDLDMDVVDLKLVANDALEQSWPLVESRRHKVVLHMNARPVMVRGDRIRLTQVVVNLLNNAAKYTPEEGLVSLTVDVEKGSAVVTVTDNGQGMDSELLPQVFGLFTQGQRTPDRSEGGLGLGLALVKSIVELHGGAVSASSEGLGKGSSFRIVLPALESAAPPRPAAPQRMPRRVPRSLHVMVVEDNIDAARSLGDWLKAQGHDVMVETDPLDALLHADNEPADVYVVDIGLPRMNGYQLARRLRANPRSREALLVALTGYGQAQDVSRAREAGFDFHMVKPMDPARLSQVLSEAHPIT